MDTLQGLKENVILGHLIPAGTAFKTHLNMRVRRLAEPVPEREVAPVEAHAMMTEAANVAAEMSQRMGLTPLTPVGVPAGVAGEGNGGSDEGEAAPTTAG